MAVLTALILMKRGYNMSYFILYLLCGLLVLLISTRHNEYMPHELRIAVFCLWWLLPVVILWECINDLTKLNRGK